MRSATGLIAGPESPPTTRASFGRRVSASIAMPSSVLMSETASAPSASTARAISTMSVTFGLSFTISGRCVAARHARTTDAAAAQSVPNAIPPASTFGHEMLSS